MQPTASGRSLCRNAHCKPGRNQLEIGIAMILPGTEAADRCKLVDDKRLWTVISSESEVFIPYAIVDYETGSRPLALSLRARDPA